MAYCLNPECPHKKKTGNPAEFREGITHCSDCGSPLSEEVIEKIDTQKITRRITLTDLHKRILYTIGFVVLWRVLLIIPVPGIDMQALGRFFGNGTFKGLMGFFGSGLMLERFSAFALGMMSYFYSYMIVEILSVFIQPLKSWRTEGYQGRMKITRIALFATFLLALLHGYALAQGLENMFTAGEKIIRNPGMSFRLISALTLATGTFITIWIAELITRKGIGHGISVLIFAGYGPRLFSNISQIILVPHKHSILEYFLLFALIVAALIFLIILLEKSKRKISFRFNDGFEAYIPLKLTSAGIMPADWASSLIMLPTTLLFLIKNTASIPLEETLMPTGIWYFIIYSVIIIFLYYLFTSFFNNPSKMTSFLKNRQASTASLAGENEENYIDRSLEAMIPIGGLYLCFIVFAPKAIFRFLGFNLDGVDLIITVAILLDLMEEVRLRRKGNHFVKVAELHDVPMAGLVKSLLEQKGLPCYLRGYYHRALLYFFGPYIEISVLVPEDRVIDAKEVIENYLYTATLIIAKAVIPAKAGIQKNTGFRVKPGMTNRIRLMSSCIDANIICKKIN